MARVTLPVISVIVPTVAGREDHLARCATAYRDHAPGAYELDLIAEHDHPTCGAGWQAGLARAHGDYIHLTCDDIEPLPGWHAPAIEAADTGFLPAPQVCDPAGEPQSWPEPGKLGEDWAPVPMTSLPFCTAAQMERIAPLALIHYFSDDWFSWRGQQAGWPARLRSGYRFTHHWAQVLRGAGMTQEQRMAHDRELYYQAQRMDLAGKWTVPWPL